MPEYLNRSLHYKCTTASKTIISLGKQKLKTEETFQALLNEADFTKEVLGSGATQIRKANYASQGLYAQAFSGLSVGLERIGKLCLILDYYISSNGSFPSFDYLKKHIGHKLELLYSRSQEISNLRGIKFNYLATLDHPLHQYIIQILHNYAEGDRYSNINLLTGAKQQNDPIAAWFINVDGFIFANLVKDRRKEKIVDTVNRAILMDAHSSVHHTTETGKFINSYSEASFHTAMFEAVAPYRQLYTLQIIRYWTELLWALQTQAQMLNRQEVPFFSEIFGHFYNGDNYLKSRKTWEL